MGTQNVAAFYCDHGRKASRPQRRPHSDSAYSGRSAAPNPRSGGACDWRQSISLCPSSRWLSRCEVSNPGSWCIRWSLASMLGIGRELARYGSPAKSESQMPVCLQRALPAAWTQDFPATNCKTTCQRPGSPSTLTRDAATWYISCARTADPPPRPHAHPRTVPVWVLLQCLKVPSADPWPSRLHTHLILRLQAPIGQALASICIVARLLWMRALLAGSWARQLTRAVLRCSPLRDSTRELGGRADQRRPRTARRVLARAQVCASWAIGRGVRGRARE